MEKLRKLSAAEMERMTPDERAQAVRERQLQSLATDLSGGEIDWLDADLG